MWKLHAIYESQPCSVIVIVGGQLYRVLEVAPTIATSLISKKQCCKVISQTAKFSFFTAQSDGEQKVIAITTTLAQDVSIQQKQVDKIVEENKENESLSYVQHNSIGHAPFQVCLGFQPLAPIDIALLATSSPTESSHT
jgi:hypothetical protein